MAVKVRKTQGASYREPPSGETSRWSCFSDGVPWYMIGLAIFVLIACISLSAYTFITETAAVCGRRGCLTLHGIDARWHSLFYIALGLGLSAFVFRIRPKAVLVLSGILFVASFVGPWFAKI